MSKTAGGIVYGNSSRSPANPSTDVETNLPLLAASIIVVSLDANILQLSPHSLPQKQTDPQLNSFSEIEKSQLDSDPPPPDPVIYNEREVALESIE